MREKALEDYFLHELVKRGWRFVESSGLPRAGLDEPLLIDILRVKIGEINPSVSHEDVEAALSSLKSRGVGPRGVRDVLEYLKFGVPVKLSSDRTSARLRLIDYGSPGKNDFVVSTQVVHVGLEEIRNDILLYVNGIPLVNIEVKNPADLGVSWEDAFRQIKRYERVVPELYKYVQIGVAAEAVAKYFPVIPWAGPESTPVYEWREEGLDSIDSTIEMLRPERLLDLLRYFLYFRLEEGRETKVIARYVQYRAANKIVDRVLRRLRGESDVDRGLIWHWQGSGKTLTMIFAAMKLYWKLENPVIFFVVDRVELQNQLYFENLTKLDLGPEVRPKLVESIERLRQVLSHGGYRGEPGLFVVTVQKFQPREFEELERFLEGVAADLPDSIMNRRDVVVFIDEAHRTQYGVLADQMERLLRRANFFAFTGTPVPRENPLKNTFAKFSPPGELYLDKYFILDSLSDGYTVKIAYMPGPFDYKLNRELLEEFLESEFEELPEELRVRVERRVERELDVRRFRVFLEDERRIDRVAEYIARHFREYVDGKFKAMVVAASRRACVLYKEALDRYLPPEYSEVVMTFQSYEQDEKIEEYRRRLLERYRVGDPKEAVSVIIERFKTEDNPRILIVTDMLLAGFDEPKLQTMYLDKPLKGHKLLQTIARVNRPYRGVKEYGLVVDFVGIFDEIAKAFAMYEREDLKGAVFDLDGELERFRATMRELTEVVGERPETADESSLIIRLKNLAELLARDKERERVFVEKYRSLRRAYELLYSKLSREERLTYEWLSHIYMYYVKTFLGESDEDRVARVYYAKTVEAISRALDVIEKEADFAPLKIDREFFDKFVKSSSLSMERKVSSLMIGLSRFKLYVKEDPVYEHVVDKIDALLKRWRERLESSHELYEEAVRLWQYIYSLEEQRRERKMSDFVFLIYSELVDAGFKAESAVEAANEIYERVKDYVKDPDWTLNQSLVKKVQNSVAEVVPKYARREGMTNAEELKALIKRLLERLKNLRRA